MHAGKTVPAVRDRLITEGLLRAEGKTLIALPPPRSEWFVLNQKKVENWYQQMRGVPICHTPKGWTPAVTATYFVLLSDNIQTGRRINHHQKKTGIAALIGVSHDTVERAFSRFQECKLLDCDYLKEPPPEVMALFPDRPPPGRRTWLASMACSPPWQFADMKDGGTLAKWIDLSGRMMLKRHYTQEEVARYWSDVYKQASGNEKLLYEFTLNWEQMFLAVETETQRNRKAGAFSGTNGFGLLRTRTITKLRSIQCGSIGVEELDEVIRMPQSQRASPGVDIEFEQTLAQRLGIS